MSQSQSPLDNVCNVVKQLIEKNPAISNAEIALVIQRRTGIKTSERSVGRARRRWGIEPSIGRPEEPRTKVEGDNAEFVTDPREWKGYLNNTDALLRERGLDPEEWEVLSIVVNEWDSPTYHTLKQLKVHLKRKRPAYIVVPARIPLKRVRRRFIPVRWPQTEARKVVLVGDQQAPYHDPRLHELFLKFLEVNQPHEGVLLGDTVDLPKISRHPDEPEWAATTQECLDAGGQIIYDYTHASSDTQWTKLAGNHDERLRRAVIDRLGDYYGLKPAQVEKLPDHPPIHDPVFLLRLDELGVKYVRAKGSYDHAQVKLSPYLAARHGWIARKGSGASAHATLDHLGHSIIVGHTHRQGKVHQTKFDVDGKPSTITAVETGCMCLIKGGLGYAVAPDWQNGFAMANVWPDGKFNIDTAIYIDGQLIYQDQRYH